MSKIAISMFKSLRQAFSAFAYEHSGEMMSLSRKKAVLNGPDKNTRD